MLGKRYSMPDNAEPDATGWVCTAICKNSCEYSARALCKNTKSYNSTFADYKWSHFDTSGEIG